MLFFSDPDSDSSNNSRFESSIGFSVLPTDVPKQTEKTNYNSKIISPYSSSTNINESSINAFDSSDNIFSALLAVTELRLSRALSPKRSYHSSDSNCSISEVHKSKQSRQKKTKSSPRNSIDRLNFKFGKDYRITTIGKLNLTWPPYGTENATYLGKHFSIFHTCPIDTGLFILYHAYKASTDDSRKLIASDTLESYTFFVVHFNSLKQMAGLSLVYIGLPKNNFSNIKM